jgi:DNA-binding transcriptional ArsR family regulator
MVDQKRDTGGADLDRVFKALSDSTRRIMLRTLARGDACVSDLALGHSISLQAVSKHVRVLEHAGLVSRRREGRNSYLQLRTAQLRAAIEWISGCERFWAGRIDALEELLDGSSAPDPERRR